VDWVKKHKLLAIEAIHLIEDYVLKLTTYGRLSIYYLIQLKIVKQTLNYSRKFLTKKSQIGTHFQRKNSSVQLRNTTTHQLLDQTSYLEDISR